MVSAVRLSDDAHAAAWRAMTVLTKDYGRFTVATVASLTPQASYPAIAEWHGWLAREMVISSEGAAWRVEVAGEAPPRNRGTNGRGSQQQRQIWTAMRALRTFSSADLVEAATTDDCDVTALAVTRFVRPLEQVGYLQRNGSRLRLPPLKDTGPRAPIPLSGGGLFDLNVGQTVNLNGLRRSA